MMLRLEKGVVTKVKEDKKIRKQLISNVKKTDTERLLKRRK